MRRFIKKHKNTNLFPWKGGRPDGFKVTILVVLCIGLRGSLTVAGQHKYADFPLHIWVMIGFPVTPEE